MKWPGKSGEEAELEQVFEDDEDFNFERIGLSDEKAPPKWRKFALIGVVGLAVVGGGWWYLNGAPRQVDDGNLPVVQAELGPIKVRPKNPGGMEIPNRDKLIYERLGSGPGAPMVERLLPEPEKPILAPAPAPETAMPSAEAPQPAAENATPPNPTEMKAVADANQAAEKTAPMKLEPVAPAPVEVAKAPAPAPEPTKPQNTPKQAAPTPVMKAPVAQAPTEPKPIVVGGKIYQIQLAAVRSEADAAKEWARLSKKHPSLLGGLSLSTQKADLGEKGIFYRLRAGPLPSEAVAKKLCADLSEKKVGCLVVRP